MKFERIWEYECPHKTQLTNIPGGRLKDVYLPQPQCVNKFKPASNDLGVYVDKFGKTTVVWRYTLQSIGPSGIALNY